MMIRPGLFLLFLITPLLAQGQEAAFRVPIDTVPETAFYRIPIGPSLTPLADPAFEKVRLRSEGEDVPFIIRKKERQKERSRYQEIDIIDRKEDPGRSSIIFERPEDDSTGRLVCYTEDPDSILWMKLHGSEKRERWKLIREGKLSSSVKDTVSSEFRIPSPFSSGHRFYRLRLQRSSGRAPRVLTIGYHEKDRSRDPAFRRIPDPKFHQKEGSEKSYIEVRLDTSRKVDRISLQVSGPPFFRRQCIVGIPKEDMGDPPYAYTAIGGSILSDSSESISHLDPHRSKRLLLIIEKGPDPPLKLEGLELYQRRKALIAHLKKGTNYELFLGGKLKDPPIYELRNYRDSIPKELPTLRTGSPIPIDPEESSGMDTLWIWLSILVAALVLAGFTFRMVKEKGSKESNGGNSSSPSPPDR